MRRHIFAAQLAVVVALMQPACSSSDAGGDTGGGPDAAASFASSECGACVVAACQLEIDDCQKDPSCTAHLECLRACPVGANGNASDDCEAQCPIPISSEGKTALAPLSTCRTEGGGSKCSACGGAAVTLGGNCAPSTQTDGCKKCIEERCCINRSACDADPDCAAIGPCFNACPLGDSACESQCLAQHESGLPLFAHVLSCAYLECPGATECGPIPMCVTCGAEKCLNTLIACDSSVDCWLVRECVGKCSGGLGCFEDCWAKHPGGKKAHWDAMACTLASCDKTCSEIE